jgi:hypothetical protein
MVKNFNQSQVYNTSTCATDSSTRYNFAFYWWFTTQWLIFLFEVHISMLYSLAILDIQIWCFSKWSNITFIVFQDAFWIAHYTAPNGRTIDEWWTGKDWEGRDRGVNVVRHLPGETDENHEAQSG